MRLVQSALPLDVPMVPLLLSEKQYHQMIDTRTERRGKRCGVLPRHTKPDSGLYMWWR